MADVELRKLTDDAARCFNRYKNVLRMNGHKIRGDTDLADIKLTDPLEITMRDEWLEAKGKATKVASQHGGSQPDLFDEEEPKDVKNPLNLKYQGIYPDDDGNEYAFVGYNEEEGFYSFMPTDEGGRGIRVDESWVRSKLNLLKDPKVWDGKPKTPIDKGISEARFEGTKEIRTVTPGRFAELRALDSEKSLKNKNAKAKEVVVLLDRPFVVVAFEPAMDLPEPTPERLVLCECENATDDDPKEGVFKVGQTKWKLTGKSMLLEAGELVDEEPAPARPDTPPPPMQEIQTLIDRGFYDEEELELSLAPRSFRAVCYWLGQDAGGDRFIWNDLTKPMERESGKITIVLRDEGVELDNFPEGKDDLYDRPEQFYWDAGLKVLGRSNELGYVTFLAEEVDKLNKGVSILPQFGDQIMVDGRYELWDRNIHGWIAWMPEAPENESEAAKTADSTT